MERGRRWLPLLAGGAILVVALFAAGTFGTAPTTTTTSTTLGASLIDEALSGPALRWEELGRLAGAGYPVAFDSFNGEYLLVTMNGGFYDQGRSLTAWRSADLVSWDRLDLDDLPEALWFDLVIDDSGLVAIAHGESGAPLVWTSEDGETWTKRSPPTPGDGFTYVQGAVRYDGRLILYGQTDPATNREFLSALPAELQDDIGSGTLSYADYGNAVVVYGPLDLVVYRATAAELGIEPFLVQATPTALVTSTDDGESWDTVDLGEARWISSMMEAPDGRLVAAGSDDGGDFIMVSTDGIHWEEVSGYMANSDLATVWGDLLIRRSSLPGLLASPDGSTWTEITPRGLLPSGPSWTIDHASGAGLGLLAAAVGWDPSVSYGGEPPALVLEKDGHLIEQSWETGEVVVTDGAGTIVATASMWSDRPSEQVRYDADADAITFIDTDDGSPIVSVTAEEWQEAVSTEPRPDPGPGPDLVLLFTRDGETWSATTPPWLTGSAIYGMGPILVEDDRALVLDLDAPDDLSSIDVTIWQGRLP